MSITARFLVGIARTGHTWGVWVQDGVFDPDMVELIETSLEEDSKGEPRAAHPIRWVTVTAEIPDQQPVVGRVAEIDNPATPQPASPEPASPVCEPQEPPRPARGYKGGKRGRITKKTAAQLPTIQRMRAEGSSIREISEATGLSKVTVQKHCEKRSRSEGAQLRWDRRKAERSEPARTAAREQVKATTRPSPPPGGKKSSSQQRREAVAAVDEMWAKPIPKAPNQRRSTEGQP